MLKNRGIRLGLAFFGLASVLGVGLVAESTAFASSHEGSVLSDNQAQFAAHLIGYNEVPSLNGQGTADLALTVASDKLTFQLTFAGLSGPPQAAHVHVGQVGVNGGVSFFFCGGGGKPSCPNSTSGTISGTVVPADVIGPITQGFAAGDLASVIAAIKAGVTYANMHTALFPAGEIRGQLVPATSHGHTTTTTPTTTHAHTTTTTPTTTQTHTTTAHH